MVRSTAMSRVLSFTIMISELTTLNAATRMISVRIRNITFCSTCTAAKKLFSVCCQSRMRTGWPDSACRMERPTRRALSGSSTRTSICVAWFGCWKNIWADSSGRNT